MGIPRNVFSKFSILLLCYALSAHAAGPTGGAVQGTLLAPGGAPVTSNSVDFKVQVLDKTGTCVMYEEEHLNVDLSLTNGDFSFDLGFGTSRVNNMDGSAALKQNVFRNDVNVAPGAAWCMGGLTFANGDARMLRVQFDVGSGYVAMTPDMRVNGSVYSVVAETLQGKSPSEFLQAKDDATYDLNQTNVENVFSVVNFAKLMDLINGTSNQYMDSVPTAAVSFNNQAITNVANPTNAQDAATKNYSDTRVTGYQVDLGNVAPGTGGGKVLVWDQAQSKWVATALSTSDNTKLPLDGSGTMTGALQMGAQNITNIGHMTMAAQRTIHVGTYTDAQETTLIASPLAAIDEGKVWYNSDKNTLRAWDGTAANSVLLSGGNSNGTTIVAGTNDNQSLQLETNNTARLTILNDGNVGIGTTTAAAPLHIARDNTASANYGVLSLGSAPFDGVSAGRYSGSANGTVIAVNSPAGFNGNMINLQVNGSEVFRLDASGAIKMHSSINAFNNSGLGLATGMFNNTPGGTGVFLNSTYNAASGNQSPLRITNNYAQSGTASSVDLLINRTDSSLGSGSHYLIDAQVAGASKFSVTNTGNGFFQNSVAIGTATPTTGSKLDITGITAADSTIIIPRSDTATRPVTGVNGMMRYNTTDNKFEFYENGGWTNYTTGSGSAGDFLKDGTVAMTGNFRAGSQWISNDGDNEGIRIANDGKVGVGVAAPTTALDVNGSGLFTVAPSATVEITTPNGQLGIKMSNGTNRSDVRFDSNVLTLVAANGTGIPASTNGISVTTAGNVGIGVVAPGAKLEVNGNIRANSNGHTLAVGNSANASAFSTIALGDSPNATASGSVAIGFAANASGNRAVAFGPNSSSSGAYAMSVGAGAQAAGEYSVALGRNVRVGVAAGDGSGSYSVAIGAGNAAGTAPRVAGNGSLGIFLGDQSGVSVTANNVMAIMGGPVGVGVVTPTTGTSLDIAGTTAATSSIIIPRSDTATRPAVGVDGMMRYNTSLSKFEFHENGGWTSFATSTGAGDFLKNGTVAMTGNFRAGSQWISNDGDNEGIRILNDGKVGVGTATPASSLDVTGTISVNGVNGLWLNVANRNLAVGNTNFPALAASTDGIAIGHNALIATNAANTLGNVAIGNNALGGTTAASSAYITAIGMNAGQNAGSGGTIVNNSVFVGSSAGQNAAAVASGTAISSVMVGASAGAFARGVVNETVFVGAYAGNNAGDGGGNARYSTVVGKDAGFFLGRLGSAQYSTVIGYQAGYNTGNAGTAANNNVLIGPFTGYSLASSAGLTANDNIMIGYGAGYNGGTGASTSGSGNILIGKNVITPTVSTSNFLNIGNTVYADLSTQNVGIGATTPTTGSRLDITGTSTANSSIIIPRSDTATRPTVGVNGMMRYNTSLSKFEFYENGGWTSFATGSGASGDFMKDGSVAMTGNFRAGSQWISNDGDSEGIRVLNDGKVGIGTATPGSLLEVNGDAKINGMTLGNVNGQTTNTALGVSALSLLAGTQTSATAIGYQALMNVGTTSQVFNAGTAVGYQAGKSITTGGNNTAIGRAALANVSTGSRNTVIGDASAGFMSGAASDNTLVGSSALAVASTASQSTAIGSDALYNATGNANTVLGYRAGRDITTGANNIIIGAYPGSGVGVTTGNNNIMIGYDVRPPSQTASDQLNIGNLIYATGLATGTTASTGFVGIANSAPTVALEVGTAAAPQNMRLTHANGSGGLTFADPSTNTMVVRRGYIASGSSITIGTTNTNPLLLMAGNSTRVQIDNNGIIAMGTTTPTAGARLDVVGTTAADSSILIPRSDTATRPTTGVNGMIRYNTTLNKFEAYENGAWTNMIGLGQSSQSSVTNFTFNSNSDASGSDGGFIFQSNGANLMQISDGGAVGIGTTTPRSALEVNGTIAGAQITGAATTVASALAAGDTTLTVNSTANFPPSGILYIPSEIIRYTGISGNTFTGLTRGLYGTTPAAKAVSTAVHMFRLALPNTDTTQQGGFLVLNNNHTIIGVGESGGPFGSNSLTIGHNSRGTGAYSLAAGQGARAMNIGSVATGNGSWAYGWYSLASGYISTADSYAQGTFGQYNKPKGGETQGSWVATDPLFVLGNGTGAGALSNALMVFKNGNMLVNGGATVAVPAGSASLTTMGTTTDNTAAAFNATNSAGSSKLYVRNDGNVGIGTTTPGMNVEIAGNSAGDVGIRIHNSNSSGWANNHFKNDIHEAWMGVGGTSSTTAPYADRVYIDNVDTQGISFGMGASGDLRIHSGFGAATERVRVTNGGSVGIGTTSPGNLLTVSGNGEAAVEIQAFDNNAVLNPLFVGKRARGTQGSPANVVSGDTVFEWAGFGYAAGAYRAAAYIGINVDGTPGAGDMPGRIDFATSPDGTEGPLTRMTVKNDGSVGIGTTAPAERLDIGGGNIKMGYEVVTNTLTTNGSVSCTAGKQVLGGGCNCTNGGGNNVRASVPNGTTGWTCMCDAGTGNTVYAICANMK